MTKNLRYGLYLCLGFVLLSGADCPLIPGGGGGGGSDSPDGGGSSNIELDLGGTSGSRWRMTFDDDFTISVKSGDQITPIVTELIDGPVVVNGLVINLSHFCFRIDTICPHEIFPQEPLFLQPDSARPELVGTELVAEGPFYGLNPAVAIGSANGLELATPLARTNELNNICSLTTESAAISIFDDPDDDFDAGIDDDEERVVEPERVNGRVTLVYVGNCITAGGSGTIPADALVEISVKFRGRKVD